MLSAVFLVTPPTIALSAGVQTFHLRLFPAVRTEPNSDASCSGPGHTFWIQFPGFGKLFHLISQHIWPLQSPPTRHRSSAPLPVWSACFHSEALTKTGEIITAGPKPSKCLSRVISTKLYQQGPCHRKRRKRSIVLKMRSQ